MGRNTLSRAEADLIKARDRAVSYRNTFDNILDLVICLNGVSELYADEDRLAEAIAARKESIANVASLAKAKPQELLIQRSQWLGLFQLGDLYVRLGDKKAAEHAYRDGLLKTRSVAARFPHDFECQYDMFSALVQLADALDRQGEAQEAFDVYVDALAVARTYCKVKPATKVREQNPIAFVLRRIGRFCHSYGEFTGARDAFNEAVSIIKAESANYPSDLRCRFELAQDLTHLACVLSTIGDYEAAVRKFELALTVLRATGNSTLQVTDCDELAGTILLQLASVHAEHGNRPAARRTYRAAVATCREMVKFSDGAFDTLKFLAHCLDEAVNDMLEDNVYEDTVVILRELTALNRRLLPFEPNSEHVQHRFSGNLRNLMECEKALGNVEAAYEATRERCAYDKKLLEANANNYVAQWRLADGLMDLCQWLDRDERMTQARIVFALMEKLEEKGRLPSHQKEQLEALRNCFESSESIATQAPPSNSDVVMCVPYSFASEFVDDVSGTCNWCGTTVRLRPHMPQNTQKICLPCVHTHWVNGNSTPVPV